MFTGLSATLISMPGWRGVVIFFRQGQFTGIRGKPMRHGHGEMDERKGDFSLSPVIRVPHRGVILATG